MPHKYANDDDDVSPPTPTDVPKIMKKAAINWIVIGALGLVVFLFTAGIKVEADNILKDYAKKDDMQKLHDIEDARASDLERKFEAMQDKLDEMNQTLSRVKYILEFEQRDNKLFSPKAKDQLP